MHGADYFYCKGVLFFFFFLSYLLFLVSPFCFLETGGWLDGGGIKNSFIDESNTCNGVKRVKPPIIYLFNMCEVRLVNFILPQSFNQNIKSKGFQFRPNFNKESSLLFLSFCYMFLNFIQLLKLKPNYVQTTCMILVYIYI